MKNIKDHSKDLYYILEVDTNCTQAEIKKSYRKLALKYHPDKCELPDTQDAQKKFMNIHNAYQVLGNPDERKKYDTLNVRQRMKVYDDLKKYIKINIPDIDNYIKLFFDDELFLKNYVANLDLVGIYSQIIEKIPYINISELIAISIDDVNIYGHIITSFNERYQDKYRKIRINRQTKEDYMCCVPLRESKVILIGEGEYDRINNKHGDVIIDIELDNIELNNITQIGDDIYYVRYITLYNYLYGGEFKMQYFDNNVLDIKFDSFIEEFPLIIIKEKGMPIANSPFYILNNNVLTNELKRGNLVVMMKIKDLINLNKDIKNLCFN